MEASGKTVLNVDDEIDAEEDAEDRTWFEFRWCVSLVAMIMLATFMTGFLVVLFS